MKKMRIICIAILAIFVLSGCNNVNSNDETVDMKDNSIEKNNEVVMDDKYYGEAEFIDLSLEKYSNLIDSKETFGILIYKDECFRSSIFEEMINQFMNVYQVKFYKLSFLDIQKTEMKDHVLYYPSFVIYVNGEMVSYLDAASDDHLEAYSNTIGFENWFTKYVKLNESYMQKEKSVEELKSSTAKTLENLAYIDYEVNVYFFWEEGCPDCEKEFEFFAEIESKYGHYFNLNTFEISHNENAENNADILEQFATRMGDEVTYNVPYTIIGENIFKGFSAEKEKDFINAILNQYHYGYDVYFNNGETNYESFE